MGSGCSGGRDVDLPRQLSDGGGSENGLGRHRSNSSRSVPSPNVDEKEAADPSPQAPPKNLFKDTEYYYSDSLLKAIKSKFKRRHRSSPHGTQTEGTSNAPASVDPDEHEEVLELFSRFSNWDFDVIGVSQMTNYHPLLYVGYAGMLSRDLFRKLSIDEAKVIQYFAILAKLHNNRNQFHNETRGASMIHSIVYMLHRGLGEILSEEDEFACLLCCCVTNICHPGLDNEYQRLTESYLSTLWNDIGTVQNVALWVWVLISFCPKKERGLLLAQLGEQEMEGEAAGDDDDSDDDSLTNHHGPIWGHIAPGTVGVHRERRKNLRETVIDMVLATDLGQFDKTVSMMKSKIENASDFASREDVKVLLQAVALFASVDYCLKTNSQYLKWVRQRLIEAFAQGDLLRSMGLSPHRLGNRDRPIFGPQVRLLERTKSLLKTLVYQFPKMKLTLPQTRRNRHYWSHIFGTERGIEFNDVQEFLQEGLTEQQERLVALLRKIPIPPNQHKNVAPEVQLSLTPKPTEEDLVVWKRCKNLLGQRFAKSNKAERRPFQNLPKLFAKCDVVKNEENAFEATTDERIEAVLCMFDRMDDWHFDMFAMEAILNQDPLVLFSYVLFVKYDWLNRFRIPEKTLMSFLEQVRRGYQRNPYHNALHAVDVMQIINSICLKGGVVRKMTNVDLLGATVAGLVHDLDHPGLNDAFQVHAFSYLAKLYNDRSVLEAHHCSETFRLMREEGLNIFDGLTLEERLDCRKTMVEMIISTDMCNHAKYVKAFNHLIEEESDFTKKDDLRVALQIAIKIADVSNPSRPTYIYLQWTRSLLKEFFRQGDMEKEMELPVSPLMDREKSVVSKGQNAFMEYVLIPMFKSFSSVFGGMSFTLELLSKNKDYWRSHETFEEEFFCPTPQQRVPIEAFVDQDIDIPM